MSTNRRKKLVLNTVAVDLGCNCRRPKLFISKLFNPKKPKYRKTPNYPKQSNLYSSGESTFSDTDSETRSLKSVLGFGRIDGESVAVEKDSDDPYLDFRQSMLQMIVENEMYSKEDLRELLNCFLQLNSPYHHGIIVRAFTEIWNGAFSL